MSDGPHSGIISNALSKLELNSGSVTFSEHLSQSLCHLPRNSSVLSAKTEGEASALAEVQGKKDKIGSN